MSKIAGNYQQDDRFDWAFYGMNNGMVYEIPSAHSMLRLEVVIPFVNQSTSNLYPDEPILEMREGPKMLIKPKVSLRMSIRERGQNATIVYLNQFHICALCRELASMLSGFQTKDLFYYREDNLVLNQELARKMEGEVTVYKKTIELQYFVVNGNLFREAIDEDLGVPGIQYEGVLLTIGEVHLALTYDELGWLLDTLRSTNLSQIALSCLSIYGSNLKSK